MKKLKKNLAWHFVGKTLRDGSPIPPDGEWLHWIGECVMCESGLHASRNPFDALQYAPGSTLCLVEVSAIQDEQRDKLVCRKRKIIARMDAAELCQYFARMQAISVLDNWQSEPDQIILEWLFTGTGAAARSAARSAAWSAARSAARSAAGSAAWSAAESAARNEFTQLVYECFEDFL